MRRAGGLYPAIIRFENLLLAAKKAQRCKRYRHDVLAFNYALEPNLLALQHELETRTYTPLGYATFFIHEPKRRLISAAPYRDRVIHHALCNVVEPIFDKTFIASSYANRKGKGTRKALDHFRECIQRRRYAFCLRADIEKYFPTVDHASLKAAIRRKIKCPETLWLIDTILDGSNEQGAPFPYFPGDDLLAPCERRIGLPIGNLTSQIWANVNLTSLDHAMAKRYGCRRYLRYVDDIALFSDNPIELAEARAYLSRLLADVRQRLHPGKTAVIDCRDGVTFLGFRFFPEHVRLRQENLRRTRRRMKRLVHEYKVGATSLAQTKNSIQSWVAHASYGDTWRLRERLFDGLHFSRH